MKIRVLCRDNYEAKKLASLIYVKDSDETFITQILNVVENEVVVSLKDKSAHSIVLKDKKAGELFADFFQSVFEKKHRIVRIEAFDEEVEIIKE
jgi:hypothetical protein